MKKRKLLFILTLFLISIIIAAGYPQTDTVLTSKLDSLINYNENLEQRLDVLEKNIDDLMWFQKVKEVAFIDKVLMTGPPKWKELDTTAPGAGNPIKFWAYVFIPKDIDFNKKYPLIVFPHSGVHANFSTYYSHIVKELIAQQYTVVSAEYRGSTGYGKEQTRIAKIPSHLVEEALVKKKKTITLAGRNAKYDAKLDLNHSYMTANGNGAVTVDFESGKRRPSTKKDVANSSRIIDSLQNVHIHWPMVSSTDQHPSVVHLHDFDASLNNTEKHVMDETGVTLSDAKTLTEMGYAAAGGEKEYRKRPLSSCLQCTYAPLQHDAGVMDASLCFADAGVPGSSRPR